VPKPNYDKFVCNPKDLKRLGFLADNGKIYPTKEDGLKDGTTFTSPVLKRVNIK
jgi:hypothetical protein